MKYCLNCRHWGGDKEAQQKKIAQLNRSIEFFETEDIDFSKLILTGECAKNTMTLVKHTKADFYCNRYAP